MQARKWMKMEKEEEEEEELHPSLPPSQFGESFPACRNRDGADRDGRGGGAGETKKLILLRRSPIRGGQIEDPP